MIGDQNADTETVNHDSSRSNAGRKMAKRKLNLSCGRILHFVILRFAQDNLVLVTPTVGLRIGWPGQFIHCSTVRSASRNLSHPTLTGVDLWRGVSYSLHLRVVRRSGWATSDEKLDASNRGDFWPVRRFRQLTRSDLPAARATAQESRPTACRIGEVRPEAWAILLFVKVKNMEVRRERVAGLFCAGRNELRFFRDSSPVRHDVTLRCTSFAVGYDLKALRGRDNAECGMRNAEVKYRILQAAVWVKLVIFVGVALSSLVSGPARSQEPAPAEAKLRIARLIEKLGSASYEERTEANDDLAQLGFESRKQLEEATESSDPEIRLRAKDLLLRLKVRELWSASPVNYEGQKITASQVLTKLSEQTGNHVLVGDQYGTFHDQEVNLNYPQGEFWQVLDDLCQQSGNRVRPHYDSRSPGLVVVQGSPGKYPTAYSGPVRTQITGARRAFTEELDYDDMGSELTHTFQLNLQMMWEDRFKLVAYRAQPDLVDAVTDTGVHLSATQSSGSGWNVASTGTRQLTMSLRLHPPSTRAKSLDILKLKWGLIAVGDIAHLDVTDLESKEPHYQDDVEVVVESVVPGQNSRYEVTLVVTRELVLPEPQEVLFQENDVELFDAEGHAFRKQGQTNSLSEHGAKMKISFAGETAQSAPKVLRFVYPRIRAQKDVEILFKDVPLPVGKPE